MADTPQVARLDSLLGRSRPAVGDLIAAEVLQGVLDERQFEQAEKNFETFDAFDAFDQVDLVGYELAVKASKNFRVLRALGITVRKTIGVLSATRCIEDGITLLHADRVFGRSRNASG